MMVKIFRKDRFKLIPGQKFKKYLLYALGEILLIISGILFAFQIEENSTAKDNRLAELKILKDLKSEYAFNLTELENNIAYSINIAENCDKLLEICYKDSSKHDLEQVNELIMQTFLASEQIFKYNDAVRNEIIATGGLSKIKNQEVRQILFDWSKQIELIQYQEAAVDRFRVQTIDLFLELGSYTVLKNKAVNYADNMARSNQLLLESNEFENTLGLYRGTSFYLGNNRYARLKKELEKAIDLIDQAIADSE